MLSLAHIRLEIAIWDGQVHKTNPKIVARDIILSRTPIIPWFEKFFLARFKMANGA